jgi:hypothetical protein
LKMLMKLSYPKLIFYINKKWKVILFYFFLKIY